MGICLVGRLAVEDKVWLWADRLPRGDRRVERVCSLAGTDGVPEVVFGALHTFPITFIEDEVPATFTATLKPESTEGQEWTA